jgi:hypothetical protein
MFCGYCRFMDNDDYLLNNSKTVIHIIHENLENSFRVYHSIHKIYYCFLNLKRFFQQWENNFFKGGDAKIFAGVHL